MELLDQAIDAVAAVDPDALGDAELHELVVGLQRDESRLAAARARLLAAWEARRIWRDDGSKAAASRLARECDLSSTTARTELGRARKLRSMPQTTEALRAGKVSIDGADLLAFANQPEVAHVFARDESMLIAEIAGLRFAHATKVVRYWLAAAHDEVDKAPESAIRDGRHLCAVRTLYGTVDVKGRLDAMAGTVFTNELRRLEQVLFEADWAEARARFGPDAPAERLARTAGQRRADALVEMARRSAAVPAGARVARPLISVLAGYGAFSKICELADGTVVSPGEVVPYLGEADIERIVFDGPSRVLDVGVRRRLFGGATRRAIEVRDRTCTHPSGCDVVAEDCDIDHIVPWPLGGETTQANGRCLCGVHNRRRNGEGRGPPPN
jgi:Domain of unknown function (DUF222)